MSEIMAKPALDVGIVSRNAGPVLSFYCKAFGFEELPRIEIPGVGVIHKLGCGQSVLKVFVPEKQPEADVVSGDFASRAGIRYLNLEVRDVRAVVEAARGAGGGVVSEPFELRPGRIVSQVSDPDGNVIEVAEGDG